MVIERAREIATTSHLVRGNSEVDLIRTRDPSFRYYFLAKPYADYAIRWPVTDGESISVHGQGNILELEGATVERINTGR